MALEIGGPSDGQVMIFFHGTPGSRLGPKSEASFLREKGVRLISYDRPSYGFSDHEAISGPYDAHDHVAAMLHYIDFDHRNKTIDLIARSGGTSYLLGAVSRWPQIVGSIVSLVPAAPRDELPTEEWYRGMCDPNAESFQALLDQPLSGPGATQARENRHRIIEQIIAVSEATQQRPTAIFDDVHGENGPTQDEQWHKEASAISHRAGLRPGPAAWLRDVLSFGSWDIDLDVIREYIDKNGRIIRSKVVLANQDVFTPRTHGEYIAARIGALVETIDGTHFAAIGAMNDAIEWCLAGRNEQS